MAGVLLLIRKPGKDVSGFRQKTDLMQKYVQKTFGAHFPVINFIHPNDNAFLIEFRKDNQKKMYRDDAGNWLTYEGTVFALDKTFIHSAESLWQLYREKSESLTDHLDGNFVIKLFDKRKQRYLIFNDFINNKLNYFTESPSVILFTPLLILSAFIKKPELDAEAFNEYMWRYYIMSTRSMLKDVARMAPGTLYHIHDTKLYGEKYWEFPHQYSSLSFSDSVEKLRTSLMESAQLIHKDGRVPVIDFTSGQDSRTILAAFTSQKLPFISTIYGKDNYAEVTHVKEMAKRHGIVLKHIKLQDEFVKDPWLSLKDDIVLSSAEEPAYLMGRILHMRRQYLRYSTLTVNGVHGRFYKDGTWNEMYLMNLNREPKSFKSDIFIKYRALNKNYRDDIFNEKLKQIKSQSRTYYKQMIETSIDGYKDSPVALQVDKMDMEHYATYGMTGNSICNNVIDLLSPLLFRRNLEFALSLPPYWKNNLSRLQRHLVYNMDPALAREDTGVAGIDMLPRTGLSHALFMMRYGFMVTQKFRDKIKNLAGMKVDTTLQKAWDYLPVYNHFYDNAAVQTLMRKNDLALGSIVNRPAWNAMLAQYENPAYRTVPRMEFILKIVTVEYFLEKCGEIGINGK